MKRFLFIAPLCVLSSALYAQDQIIETTASQQGVSNARTELKAGEIYGEFCGNSLDVPGLSDNNNQGIMFDIEATENVYLSGFSVKLLNNYSGYVSIYRRIGTHVGFENNIGSWVLVDSAFVTDDGSGGYTYIPIEVGPTINAGGIASFYIRGNVSSSVVYSNGTTVGTTIVSDASIIVKEGTGISGIFGSTFTSRKFEGEVHYCSYPTVVCDTAETQINDANSNNGIYFNLTAGSQEITLNKIHADLFGTSGQKLNVQVYHRTGTHVGFEGSALGWTLISDQDLYSPLSDYPTIVAIDLNLVIPANSTNGFLVVTSPPVLLNYTNSTNAVGDVFYNDGNITVHTGVGTSNPFIGASNPQRNFNGGFDYCVDNAGLDELNALELNLWPNPVNNELFLMSSGKTVHAVEVHNTVGQTVEIQLISTADGNYRMDVSQLSRGTYIIHAQVDGKFVSRKFVKL